MYYFLKKKIVRLLKVSKSFQYLGFKIESNEYSPDK